jgi:hypothetical protein
LTIELSLINQKKINSQKELVREVEMGPFKHTVDDGLDRGKAAFECMYTLLDSCLDRLDVFEFLNLVELGLKGLLCFLSKSTQNVTQCSRSFAIYFQLITILEC